MSRSVKIVSTVAVIGLLAGCGGGGAAPVAASAPGDAPVDATRAAAQARATRRVLNSLRVRGHHNVRRPRHLSQG